MISSMPADSRPSEALVAGDVAEVEGLLGHAPGRAFGEHVAGTDLRSARRRCSTSCSNSGVSGLTTVMQVPPGVQPDARPPATGERRRIIYDQPRPGQALSGTIRSTEASDEDQAAVLWEVGTPWSVEEIELDAPGRARSSSSCAPPGCATPTITSSPATWPGRCRSWVATKAQASSLRSGRASPASRSATP